MINGWLFVRKLNKGGEWERMEWDWGGGSKICCIGVVWVISGAGIN